MNTLYKTIKDNPAVLARAQTEDWDGVASLLNNTMVGTPVKTLRNSRWLMANFATVVDQETGATEADIILGTLQAATVPRVKEALALMGGEGINLSDPQVTGMIALLGTAGGWSSDIKEKLAAFAVDKTSLAQRSGLSNVTAQQCENEYIAGVANNSGELIYDQRRILLCLNDGPVNDSLTIRYTPVGVVGGIEVSGPAINSGGVSSNLKGRDKQLYADLLAAVAQWESS